MVVREHRAQGGVGDGPHRGVESDIEPRPHDRTIEMIAVQARRHTVTSPLTGLGSCVTACVTALDTQRCGRSNSLQPTHRIPHSASYL